jgi:hypothetical protein
MGSVKKALKPITRVVDDIIPNEIKPALPYIAATFGAPYLAGSGLFKAGGILSALGQGALAKGASAGLINLGTQAALGQKINPVSAGVSGLLAGGGAFLGETGSKLGEEVANIISPGKAGGMTLGEAFKAAATPVTAGAAQAGYDAAKEAEDAYETYLAEQRAAGNEDIETRTVFITRYLKNAGFDQDYIDSRLNELGYAANGGLMGTRVGFDEGGSSSIEQQKRENYFDLKRDDFMSMSEYLESGLSDTDLRSGAAEGGIMNLKVGGKPAEMDLRKGGFVPIGAKEKADDVPARLSKNEFVMTADAVRAAGGGSVNKGAKKMYDLMNKLEARV